MLVFGTQMHIVTFLFVCIEIVILFYLIIYRLARPDDKMSFLDIILISLLLVYNITGGLLPDPKLPGSFFIQESIAYGTGFITPCYFPYYVYRGFDLKKMKFHAYSGVYFFLVGPYAAFVTVFALSGQLEAAKNILIVPVVYALWVLISLAKAIRYKYNYNSSSAKARNEVIILFLSISPWIGLPFISYFDLNQWIEACITNGGFLLLLAFHVNRHIKQIRMEHERLVESEKRLMTWNEHLQAEVERRTRELERITSERRFEENSRQFNLTNREKEIAWYICKGFAYRGIGERLHIAETTVAKHVQNIFEKVGVNSKMELSQKLERLLDFKYNGKNTVD
ncbi:MAG: response regulator transcription factor [Flavisolibacter sp.]|nr:response regulator transcription factor [Flavisolibacter sp.]